KCVSIIGDLRHLMQGTLSGERQKFFASFHVPKCVIRAQKPTAIGREIEGKNRVSPAMQSCFLLLQMGIEDHHAAMVSGERGSVPVGRISAAGNVSRRPE